MSIKNRLLRWIASIAFDYRINSAKRYYRSCMNTRLQCVMIMTFKREPRLLCPRPLCRFSGTFKISNGVAENEFFGGEYLYKYWKKVYANLDIEDVDLYKGAKHNTVTTLRKIHIRRKK